MKKIISWLGEFSMEVEGVLIVGVVIVVWGFGVLIDDCFGCGCSESCYSWQKEREEKKIEEKRKKREQKRKERRARMTPEQREKEDKKWGRRLRTVFSLKKKWDRWIDKDAKEFDEALDK